MDLCDFCGATSMSREFPPLCDGCYTVWRGNQESGHTVPMGTYKRILKAKTVSEVRAAFHGELAKAAVA